MNTKHTPGPLFVGIHATSQKAIDAIAMDYAVKAGRLRVKQEILHAIGSALLPQPVLDPARAVPDYDGMDDIAEFGVTQAARDRMTDDQVDAANLAHSTSMAAEALEEVKHAMREAWRVAVDNHNALSTPKLPTFVAGTLVPVPVRVLIGDLMDAHWPVELLTDALRTGDMTPLHLQLRTTWIDANAAGLLALGWKR